MEISVRSKHSYFIPLKKNIADPFIANKSVASIALVCTMNVENRPLFCHVCQNVSQLSRFGVYTLKLLFKSH